MLWLFDEFILGLVKQIKFLCLYTKDPISSRITLILLIIGFYAFINQVFTVTEMVFTQRDAYIKLRQEKLDETLKQHRLIVDDMYHGREFVDKKTGVLIEEFESIKNFFSKPIHVAHLHVKCRFVNSSIDNSQLPRNIVFHIEFSPEEYEGEFRPEFGTTLKILRRRVYHLIKDTEAYRKLESKLKLPSTASKNVKLFNTLYEELGLNLDDIQLCFLKIETGDTITCDFSYDMYT